jgi:hypothetical protein
MLKMIGSLLQGFGLLFFLVFSVSAGALGIYTLISGQSGFATELGNAITVISFFGAVPLGLLVLGSMLIKKATSNSFFPNKTFEILAKLVIVPISIALSASLAVIMVPFLAYRYYQHRKGVETGTVRFVKWACEDWYMTLTLYIVLVLSTLFTLVL